MKKNAKTEVLLGCSIAELRIHIERQFTKGMSWGNRAEWHLDHIVPLDTATTIDDVVALCHHTNLRPIWRLDNLRKGSKVTHLI